MSKIKDEDFFEKFQKKCENLKLHFFDSQKRVENLRLKVEGNVIEISNFKKALNECENEDRKRQEKLK